MTCKKIDTGEVKYDDHYPIADRFGHRPAECFLRRMAGYVRPCRHDLNLSIDEYARCVSV